jgi:hypothetical protein
LENAAASSHHDERRWLWVPAQGRDDVLKYPASYFAGSSTET